MHLATLIDEDAVERTKRPAQGECGSAGLGKNSSATKVPEPSHELGPRPRETIAKGRGDSPEPPARRRC
jgi:hypothetical protein